MPTVRPSAAGAACPAPRTPARPILVAAAGAAALALGGPASAGAEVVLTAPPDVVEEQPFTVAYEATGPDRQIALFAKPAGAGVTCAGRPEDERGEPVLDEGAVVGPTLDHPSFAALPSTGRTTPLTLPEPGTLLVCAYGRVAGTPTATSRSTLTVHVRAAKATIELAGLERSNGSPVVGPGDSASFRLRGTVEAPRTVEVRFTEDRTCPERGTGVGTTVAPGSFDVPVTLPVPPRGPRLANGQFGSFLRLVCAWVQGGDEVEAVIWSPLEHRGPPEVACSHGCHPPPTALLFPRTRTRRIVRGRVEQAPIGGRVALARRGSRRVLATAPIRFGRFVLEVPRSAVGRRLVVRVLSADGKVVLARSVTSKVRPPAAAR